MFEDIGAMMNLIKRIATGLAIFFAFYLFGNFRINDVNIRDFLQKSIPPDRIVYVKDQLVDLVAMVYQRFEVTFHVKPEGAKDYEANQNTKNLFPSYKDWKKLNSVEKMDPADEAKMLNILKGKGGASTGDDEGGE